MRTGQRRREILHHLFNEGYVAAAELADRFGVNTSTIRRDLEALSRDGYLRRTHGGASLVSGAVDIPYAQKLTTQVPQKLAIAQEARSLVRAGDSVLLDSGSTTYELALLLRDVADLTLVTNDLRIARVVADFPMARLLVIGGERLSATYTMVGDRAVSFIEEMRVDTTFLGADAIALDAGITNTNAIEVPLKRAMLNAGHQVVVLADSEKFGRRALMKICGLEEIGLVLTDDGMDDPAFAELDLVRRIPVTHRDDTRAPETTEAETP